MSELHPTHFSIAGKSRRPAMMEAVNLPRDQIEAVERIALDVFADMSNVGQPFPKALAAIYFTGMQHALEIMKAKPQ